MRYAESVPEWAKELHSALDDKLGTEVMELSASRVVGRAPVAGNTQPMGLWHGGASGVLVETLASLGAQAVAREHEGVAVGVDLNVTHLRAVRQGWVTGTATVLHAGRRVTAWQVELRDDHDHVVAVGRLTCQIIAPA